MHAHKGIFFTINLKAAIKMVERKAARFEMAAGGITALEDNIASLLNTKMLMQYVPLTIISC